MENGDKKKPPPPPPQGERSTGYDRFQRNKSENDGQKTWTGPIADIKKHSFIYGRDMLSHNSLSMEHFIEYVGNNHTKSSARSLEKDTVALIGVAKPNLTITTAQLGRMAPAKQSAYARKLKYYDDARCALLQEDAQLSAKLMSMCTVQLQVDVHRSTSEQAQCSSGLCMVAG